METDLSQKIPKIFSCDFCDYSSYNRKDFLKHESTRKHCLSVARKPMETFGNKKIPKANLGNKCDICGKNYSHRSGLWKHKKQCSQETRVEICEDSTPPQITNELVLELIKQNKDLQNVLMEQNNKIMEMANKQQLIVNNTTNNHNQQFNLQFFLNETCKDAVNLMDFVRSLKLRVEDFEETGRLGYVEGISRIIINALQNMDIERRPLHCTDIKRETLYIRDQNSWEKENPDKNKFKKAVNCVAQLNLNQLTDWQVKYPECIKLDTHENEQFIKLSMAALGGRTKDEEEKYMDKILKNVLKEVVIDKK